MADMGIARVNNDSTAGATLTRADLADIVHRRLGLSRAESASLVERVLHHMCHRISLPRFATSKMQFPYVADSTFAEISRDFNSAARPRPR